MSRHSLIAGLIKSALARFFVRRVSPVNAFPNIPKVVPRHNPAAEVVPTPELPGTDLYPQGRYLKHSNCKMPSYYGMVMPEVTYYPRQGLLLDRANRLIEDTHQVPMRRHWCDWRAFFPAEVKEVPGASFVFRSFRENIYHFLVDHLPTLYLLGELPWQSSERIKLLLPSPRSEAERYLLPLVCPPNVDIVEVSADPSYRLERCYYVSQLTQRGCGFLPNWYLQEFLGRVTPDKPRQRNKRIYISRHQSQNRRILNESELVQRLAGLGFEAYELESMTIPMQIELFHDAEVVVAVHGAGLVNVLYAEHAKILELFAGPLVRPHFYFLCKARGHSYSYIRSSESSSIIGRAYEGFVESFNGSDRDFTVDCDRVVRHLETLL